MKTAHRKAARWKEKNVRYPPGTLLARLQPLSKSDLLNIQLPTRMAFESLRTGKGNEQDFHDIAAAINVALVRSESINPLCVLTCQKAQAALLRMIERHNRMGVWGMDGLALQEIPLALDLYDQILALSNPQQLMDAMRETLTRMRRGDVYQEALCA